MQSAFNLFSKACYNCVMVSFAFIALPEHVDDFLSSYCLIDKVGADTAKHFLSICLIVSKIKAM